MNAKSVRGEETRQRIIQAAFDLFHKQGVAGTSPDDVIEKSGTGKGQFYHYFKSKEGLVHAVLQAFVEEIRKGRSPFCFEINDWKDLHRWFLVQLDIQKRYNMSRGCPIGTIGNGLAEDDELIRQDLNLAFELMKKHVLAFFVREMAKGRIVSGMNADQLADYCLIVMQGAMLMGKIRKDSETVERMIRVALDHVQNASPRAAVAEQTG